MGRNPLKTPFFTPFSPFFTHFCKKTIKNNVDYVNDDAITRLSKKLDVLTLARVVGHKRIQQLMTYYNESAEDIALRL